MAKDIAAGKMKVDRQKKGLVANLTATAMKWDWVKNIIFNKAKEQVMKASKGLYPAPLKVNVFTTLLTHFYCGTLFFRILILSMALC